LAPKITELCFGFVIFGAKILYKKRVCKTLMKLTPGSPSGSFAPAKDQFNTQLQISNYTEGSHT